MVGGISVRQFMLTPVILCIIMLLIKPLWSASGGRWERCAQLSRFLISWAVQFDHSNWYLFWESGPPPWTTVRETPAHHGHGYNLPKCRAGYVILTVTKVQKKSVHKQASPVIRPFIIHKKHNHAIKSPLPTVGYDHIRRLVNPAGDPAGMPRALPGGGDQTFS